MSAPPPELGASGGAGGVAQGGADGEASESSPESESPREPDNTSSVDSVTGGKEGSSLKRAEPAAGLATYARTSCKKPRIMKSSAREPRLAAKGSSVVRPKRAVGKPEEMSLSTYAKMPMPKSMVISVPSNTFNMRMRHLQSVYTLGEGEEKRITPMTVAAYREAALHAIEVMAKVKRKASETSNLEDFVVHVKHLMRLPALEVEELEEPFKHMLTHAVENFLDLDASDVTPGGLQSVSGWARCRLAEEKRY
jgi:hypothetical protein